MKEVMVLEIGYERRWYFGTETFVTEFDGKFQEIFDAVKRWPNSTPIFYHTHPDGFETLSQTDIDSFKGIVYGIGKRLEVVLINRNSIKSFDFRIKNNEIVYSQTIFIGKMFKSVKRLIKQAREISYEQNLCRRSRNNWL